MKSWLISFGLVLWLAAAVKAGAAVTATSGNLILGILGGLGSLLVPPVAYVVWAAVTGPSNETVKGWLLAAVDARAREGIAESTGYELAKTVAEMNGEGDDYLPFGTLYRALADLRDDGLLTRRQSGARIRWGRPSGADAGEGEEPCH